MNTDTVLTRALTAWHTVERDSLDIDWPGYHREIGLTQFEWLCKREREGKCVLVIERKLNRARLCVDFLDDRTVTEYHLMWSEP